MSLLRIDYFAKGRIKRNPIVILSNRRVRDEKLNDSKNLLQDIKVIWRKGGY
jgi:hypothetical protein